MNFTFDDQGYLDWHIHGGKPSLTLEQAAVVAAAENAAALRYIGETLRMIPN